MSVEVSSSLNITVPDLSGLSAEEKEQVLNVMKKARVSKQAGFKLHYTFEMCCYGV